MLAGVERAHSLVYNRTNGCFTPIDLSAFYTRRPDILKAGVFPHSRISQDPG